MLADPARTGYVAVALPEEMPVNETIELERRLRDAIGLGLDAVVMNAMWPERFSSSDVTKLRAAARDGHDESELGAVRAALAVHERVKAQRAHLRRLERGDRGADHARSRSSSSPSSGWPTTSGSRASFAADGRARAPALPARPPGLAAQQLGFWGARDRRRRDRGVRTSRRRPVVWRSRPCCAWLATCRPGAALGALALGIRDEGIDIQHGTLDGQPHAGAVDARAARRHQRGLFEQAFGLATVVVHTAAGGHTIPLLPQAEAERAARADRRSRAHRR